MPRTLKPPPRPTHVVAAGIRVPCPAPAWSRARSGLVLGHVGLRGLGQVRAVCATGAAACCIGAAAAFWPPISGRFWVTPPTTGRLPTGRADSGPPPLPPVTELSTPPATGRLPSAPAAARGVAEDRQVRADRQALGQAADCGQVADDRQARGLCAGGRDDRDRDGCGRGGGRGDTASGVLHGVSSSSVNWGTTGTCISRSFTGNYEWDWVEVAAERGNDSVNRRVLEFGRPAIIWYVDMRNGPSPSRAATGTGRGGRSVRGR